MSVRHRVVLTGGGTGGHVYPALAVAEQLKRDQSCEAFLYFGAAHHVEERLAKENDLPFIGLSVAGLPRSLSPKLASFPFHLISSVARAHRELRRFGATVVLGTGGYASAPCLVAALMLGLPVAIHEPDAHPGLVNRLIAPYAHLISLGMADAQATFARLNHNVRVFGNPVSARFSQPHEREKAAQALGVFPDLPTLLITGGSQGAQAVNRAVFDDLERLIGELPSIQVIHQTGDGNWTDLEKLVPERMRQNPLYRPRKYFDDLSLAYACSDLTICRAGAMTIAELYITGTPAIFIPLPSAAQDHQTFNARSVEAQGGAAVLLQSELVTGRLASTVRELIFDQQKLAYMRSSMQAQATPNASSNLADAIKKLSKTT